MTRILIAGLVLVALTPTAAAAARRSTPVARCPSTHVVAADSEAEVYLGRGRIDTHEYYGCAFAHPHPYLLGPKVEGSAAGGGGVALFDVGGPYVGYEEYADNAGNYVHWLIIVKDLRTGRTIKRLPTGPSAGPEEIGGGSAKDILVSRTGSVAWIVHPLEPETYEVDIADRSGTRTIAVSPEIAPTSLASADGRLYWSQSGAAHEAPFS